MNRTYIFILLLLFPVSSYADAWDCTVPESHDDTANGTFQIYIVCELPDGNTDRYGPSLDAIDRAVWEFGSNDDKDLIVATHVETMKAQYAERTAVAAAPVIARGNRTSTATARARIDKVAWQARIDAMDDADPDKARLQARLDTLP
jgi:hypothetical protein